VGLYGEIGSLVGISGVRGLVLQGLGVLWLWCIGQWTCDGCLIVRVVDAGVGMGGAAGLVGVGVSSVGV